MNPAPRHNCYADIMRMVHQAAPEMGALEDEVLGLLIMDLLRKLEAELRQDCLDVILPAGSKIRA